MTGRTQYAMNTCSVAALGLGSMVGAGIFALLGQVALSAGQDTYLVFLLGGVIAISSGYSYAKLAARYPEAGGIAEYFDEAFGPRTLSGTLSLIYLLTLILTVALVAKAFGAYGARLFLDTDSRFWVNALASLIIVAAVIANVAKSNLVGNAELVLVLLKLSVLALLMLAGMLQAGSQHVAEHLHPTLISLFGSVGLSFLAYAGFGTMANAAESVDRPEVTIPRAIYVAIFTVAVLYVGLAYAVLSAVSPAQLAKNADTALAIAAEPLLGHLGYLVVSIAALLATASAINATIFSILKIGSALSTASHLPQCFSRPVCRSASLGAGLGAVTMLIMVNMLDLNALASVASGVYVLTYLAVQVAHWRLKDATGGSPLMIAVGSILMAAVLVVGLVTLLVRQPWSIVTTLVILIACASAEMTLSWLDRPPGKNHPASVSLGRPGP